MVEYCESQDEELNHKTLTTFNILENYEINDIIYSKCYKSIVGYTYVKGTQNTKIDSLSK